MFQMVWPYFCQNNDQAINLAMCILQMPYITINLDNITYVGIILVDEVTVFMVILIDLLMLYSVNSRTDRSIIEFEPNPES